jgi:uncharacterized OB-fold protein
MANARYSLDPHTDGLARGELLVSVCAQCAAPQFPPKARCFACGAAGAPDWVVSAGTGRLWSFATFHKTYLPEFALPTPYVVAVVALDEGLRLYGNVVGVPADALQVGLPVRAQFDETRISDPRLTFTADRRRNR